jgi:hypothetical protein
MGFHSNQIHHADNRLRQGRDYPSDNRSFDNRIFDNRIFQDRSPSDITASTSSPASSRVDCHASPRLFGGPFDPYAQHHSAVSVGMDASAVSTSPNRIGKDASAVSVPLIQNQALANRTSDQVSPPSPHIRVGMDASAVSVRTNPLRLLNRSTQVTKRKRKETTTRNVGARARHSLPHQERAVTDASVASVRSPTATTTMNVAARARRSHPIQDRVVTDASVASVHSDPNRTQIAASRNNHLDSSDEEFVGSDDEEFVPSDDEEDEQRKPAASDEMVVTPRVSNNIPQSSFFNKLRSHRHFDILSGSVANNELDPNSSSSSSSDEYEDPELDGNISEGAEPPTCSISISSVIDVRERSPKLYYEDIPVLTKDESSATLVKQWFVCELRTAPAIHDPDIRPLKAKDICKLVAFERGTYGCYSGNRFEQNYHYTQTKIDFTKLRHKATKRNIPVEYINKGTSVTINERGFNFFISNEDQFKDEILGLGIEEIFYDSVLKNHPKERKKMLIAKPGKRGNRGPNLGVAGGESNECDNKTKIQKPTITVGSQRYGKSSQKMTELHKKMHAVAGFSTYIDEDKDSKRLEDFAQSIHPGTIFEQDGYLYLVHDEEDNLCFLDVLRIHADTQTDPQWNFLSCGWVTFFSAPIGRFVTGMRTSSHKKSVPDYYGRIDNIGVTADKILDMYASMPEYRQLVDITTLFPIEGDSFLDADVPHYIIDSHADPFVHIGVVVHTIFRLRDFLKIEMDIKMSLYLVYEMIYAAFDESNNMLRYATFADLHYQDWQDQRVEPLPEGTSFIDAYQLWLRTNYPANDGIAGMLGGPDEGVVRYCANNNTARMNGICHRNVRCLHDTIGIFSKKKITETAYKSMLSTLNKGTVGASELKLQKMIYAVACCNENFSLQWITFCRPGSKEHLERLKEQKFPINSSAQVGQVLKAMVEKAGIPAPVAEHIMCVCLSNKTARDVIIAGYDLFMCFFDQFDVIQVCCVDADDGTTKSIVDGGFENGDASHYYPGWAKPFTGLDEYGLLARFPNDRNMEFNICEKTPKSVREEKIVSANASIKLTEIQSLLTKNRSLAIAHPVEFVAQVYKIDLEAFTKAIKVKRSETGEPIAYYAEIDTSVFDKTLVRTVKQIWDTRSARHPVYQLSRVSEVTDLETGTSKQMSYYKSEAAAIINLMLHLLTNVHRRDGQSWTFRCLQNTKELIILVPFSECFGTMDVVATLFRTTSSDSSSPKVLMRYFDSKGDAITPIVVAKDNVGSFK